MTYVIMMRLSSSTSTSPLSTHYHHHLNHLFHHLLHHSKYQFSISMSTFIFITSSPLVRDLT